MAPPTNRWRYLAVGFVTNVMLGTAYSWSVFTQPLRDDFGATDFGAMLPMALALATFSVGMVFAGRLVDRLGPRRVAVAGGVLVGAGYMASALVAVSPWPIPTLTITYGLLVGVGIGFAYNPPIPTAIQWFPDRKGLATGVVVMGFGLSPLFTAPLADALIASVGVPATFLALGAMFLVVLVPLGSRLRFPPEDWRAPPTRRESLRAWAPVAEMEARAMLRTPAFWSAWLLYVFGTAGGFMVIGKAKPIAVELGAVSGGLAVGAVMVLAVFNSLGRPVFGRLVDAQGIRRTLPSMYVGLLGAMALLAVSTSYAGISVGIAATGFVFGGFLAVMPAVATSFFGTKNLGTNYGFLFTGYGLGALVALFAIGPVRDAFGTYVPAFYVGIALSAAGLVLSLLVKPPRPVVDAPRAPAKGPTRRETSSPRGS